MASNPAKPKTSRWGSLLSGAVAGLESRLDNIFAEEEERAARDKAAGNVPRGTSSANSPVSNDRLKERLAKAVANPSRPSSEVPSRSGTPLLGTVSPRVSTSSRPSTELSSGAAVTATPDAQPAKDAGDDKDAISGVETSPEPSDTLLTSALPINPARLSEDTQSRPFIQIEDHSLPTPTANGDVVPPVAFAETDAEEARTQSHDTHPESQHQEEMLAYLERIDALQAKLQYLAKETVTAAKEANASAQPASLEQKIAEKDERIALLMEEGSKLSKTEMRHLSTIKKLRQKNTDVEKTTSDLQKKLSKLEASETHLKQRLNQVEQAEKLANDRVKRLQKVDKDLGNTKYEVESSKATIAALRHQLADAEKRADNAERLAQDKTFQLDSKKVSELQDQISDLKLEKKLAEDRFAAETKRLSEGADHQKDSFNSREAELIAELSNMESRIEALRSRAEEATAEVTGDSQAKLLRQVETLQTQYSLAAENWRTIESSLNSRITAMEKERDEAVKREADIRKKARDVSNKSKRAEEELERVTEESQDLSQQLQTRASEIKTLQTRLSTVEKTLEECKADFDRQRRVLESEYNQKLEEEKARQAQHGLDTHGDMSGPTTSPLESSSYFRSKNAGQESSNSPNQRRSIQRLSSHDLKPLSVPRRQSTMVGNVRGTSDILSPSVSRQGSGFSLSQLNGHANGIPRTPSIHMTEADADEAFDFSPQRTINDVISASTVHTGPSVQLVERMSSSIRRLESEKAAHKDELARLISQRDESRNEVVALMREMDSKHQSNDRSSKLESELGEVKKRYEACLEMLGEREEEVADLKADVVELKRIYRDLAERSMK
ncbi:TATA element modulatory factor 1 TATA binding-domain-containing protein [Delphinella strobiligena]|nr:TATA element modulatory factor 1 TATA binding-domain-containing protein [Delphinella strobiligena]